MTGAISPRQFGERLEAAAENDRRRRANPELVEYRHPIAGTLLLAGIAGGAFWLLRRNGRGNKGQSANASGTAETAGTFGRLRPAVAATFVGPSFLLYLALVIFPAGSALWWAFTRWDGLSPRTWAGLFHFKSLLFESDTLWAALRNNLFLVVVPTLVVVPVALLFAGMIHRGVAGGKLFRVVFLFPNMLGGIAATLLWLNAYEPHGGLVNATLVGIGELLNNDWLRSFDGFAWLTPARLYGSLVPIYLWMACGFNLILYLAAMEGIDTQLYEAAEIDGASRTRQFFSITLPMIWDVIGISAVFLIIAGLNAFEMIWLLTSQDPTTANHTLSTLLVTTMFKSFDIGRATAVAVLLLALVLVASAGILRALKRDAVE
jgi:raffinose/stachyose/melibiose transport system permease protein